ncbi:MAG: phosphoglycerate kinase [Candidatus Saccharibacteria bacterium]|nr:phosphoglycerate kinase [Candidatus Saccharibacteria bacterium]
MTDVVFPYQTVRDVDVAGKTVLMRVDYNVPLTPEGAIADDFRVTASLPTIQYLIEHGAKVVLIAHLGRPKGQRNDKYSLQPVATDLSEKLHRPVTFINDCIGDTVHAAVNQLQVGDVTLLENLRFYNGEEENDQNFAKQLAKSSGADLFVQDGFGVVHRPHASTVAIATILPSVAGLLLEREYLAIKNATDAPNRPLTAVIGGAKISDKMPLVRKFMEIADNVVIGGALANNILKHQGYDIGNSLVEDGAESLVADIMAEAEQKYGSSLSEKFITPRDVAVSMDGSLAGAARVEKALDAVRAPEVIFDSGERTIDAVDRVVEASGTVIWNGTLGMAEYPAFSRGSARLALTLAKNPQIISVIGGGDTADFVRNWDTLHGGSFTHVSTGGGASLELMAGDILPGIDALMRK